MKIKLTLLSCLAFWGTTVLAQQQSQQPAAYIFNLDECIKYAHEHQSQVLNAQLDQQIAAAKVKETIGIGLPQVNGTLSFQDYIKSPVILFPNFQYSTYKVLEDEKVKNGDGNTISIPPDVQPVLEASFQQKYNAAAGVQLNQLLFDGQYLIGLKATNVYKELSSKNTSRTKIETAVAVSKAYYSTLVTVERLKLLTANIERLQKILEETQAMNKNGFVEKIDVDRLSVQLNNLKTEKAKFDRLSVVNEYMLKFQMGMPINDQLKLKDEIATIQFEPVQVQDTLNVTNRIEYSLLETQKHLSELDLKRNKVAVLPSVGGFATYNTSFQNPIAASLFDKAYPTFLVGLQINVPIFSGGQKKQRINQAKYALQQVENQMVNVKNGLALENKSANIVYANSLESMENQKRNMELAREILRVTKVKYSQGVGSSLEVTTAETDLKAAETNYIGALYDALVAQVDLKKASGKFNY
ncbi:TolC family protein [Solitalea koreensis]|uniref:Outer membrane protein TolC n=1 Tax=Solitalea koreensis TaxID=543615 RepID=A0A521E1D3_9SPHI|nr:TolC family protein [Solitalea koreensis]SMO77764.1 Outer membrane protein TolC [Solitalea koreensis]